MKKVMKNKYKYNCNMERKIYKYLFKNEYKNKIRK